LHYLSEIAKRSCCAFLLSGFLNQSLFAEDKLPIVSSDSTPKRWINFGGTSWHANKNSEHNTDNYGLGIEYGIGAHYSLVAGQYKNSSYNESLYAGLAWMPVKFSWAKLGLVAGFVDGYRNMNNGNLSPFLMPALSIEGKMFGINLVYLPPANEKMQDTLALQFKIGF
jgi:hypothetical protein